MDARPKKVSCVSGGCPKKSQLERSVFSSGGSEGRNRVNTPLEVCSRMGSNLLSRWTYINVLSDRFYSPPFDNFWIRHWVFRVPAGTTVCPETHRSTRSRGVRLVKYKINTNRCCPRRILRRLITGGESGLRERRSS